MTPGAAVFAADRGSLTAGGAVLLDGPEGRHAATVRRLRAGERVLLTDGAGRLAGCVVTEVRRDALALDVVHVVDEPAPRPRLVVVQALPKGDRGEVAVETLTEVGADVVVPWAAHRCVTQWRAERGERALSRWRSTAREAAKQSRRAWWPRVAPLASTAGADRAAHLHRGHGGGGRPSRRHPPVAVTMWPPEQPDRHRHGVAVSGP